MELEYNISNSTAIITLSSNILGTPADSKLFESSIKTLLVQGIKKVILDMSHVNRINSTGLAILITGFNLMTKSGGVFILANPNDFIVGAITITKLIHVLPCVESVDQAVGR